MTSKHKSSGQSMFEVMVAMAVASIILISIVGLAAKSVGNSTSSSQETIGQGHSKELAEWLKKEKETSWSSITANAITSLTWCMKALQWTSPTFASDCTNTDFIVGTSIFVRKAVFGCFQKDKNNEYSRSCNDTRVNIIKYNAHTYWYDGAGIHYATVSSSLSKWIKP